MEWMAKWAKNLISLVIFAAFLELLLPSSQMQKFLRVIVGLLVMLAILQPLTGLLQLGFPSELPVFLPVEHGGAKKFEIGQDQMQRVSQQVFCKELARQVESTVEALEGVEKARVTVELGPEKEMVKRLMIHVIPGAKGAVIQPILVKEENFAGHEALDETLKNKILYTVAELYQVPRAKITVKEG